MSASNKTKAHKGKHNKTSKNKPKLKISCSPAKNKDDKNFTCYSTSSLEQFKLLWNTRHGDDIITTNEPHKIWNALRQRLSRVCDTEQCWMRQKFVLGKLDYDTVNYTFAPDAPKTWLNNPTEWLSNADIIDVMKHYEYYFSNFAFIGPTPIDFDKQVIGDKCVWDELCNFSLTKMIKKHKNKIGIIFNTDPHTKNGEHWVSMFIDMTAKPKPYIFYFDSAGDPIKKEIEIFSNRIVEQAKNQGISLSVIQNHPKIHQKGETECGIYSLYLIIELLTGRKDYKFFLNNSITDKTMEKFRHIYFNQQS